MLVRGKGLKINMGMKNMEMKKEQNSKCHNKMRD